MTCRDSHNKTLTEMTRETCILYVFKRCHLERHGFKFPHFKQEITGNVTRGIFKNEPIKYVLLLLLCTFQDVFNKYIHDDWTCCSVFCKIKKF